MKQESEAQNGVKLEKKKVQKTCRNTNKSCVKCVIQQDQSVKHGMAS